MPCAFCKVNSVSIIGRESPVSDIYGFLLNNILYKSATSSHTKSAISLFSVEAGLHWRNDTKTHCERAYNTLEQGYFGPPRKCNKTSNELEEGLKTTILEIDMLLLVFEKFPAPLETIFGLSACMGNNTTFFVNQNNVIM